MAPWETRKKAFSEMTTWDERNEEMGTREPRWLLWEEPWDSDVHPPSTPHPSVQEMFTEHLLICIGHATW